MLPGSASRARVSTAARSRLGSPYAVLDLEPEPDGAVLADQGRRGSGEERAQQDGAVALGQGQRRGRRGHELAHRDDVGLTRQARRRVGRRRWEAHRRRCRGRPCSDDPTRTGRAGADRRLPPVRGTTASVRVRWRDFFPMPRTLGGGGALGSAGQARASRACTVVRERVLSTHQRAASVSTIERPRPARSETPASTRSGVVRAPPSVTAMSTPLVAGLPGDAHGAVGERAGVAHGVADQLADHEAGVVAGLVARRRGRASTRPAAGGPRSRSPG